MATLRRPSQSSSPPVVAPSLSSRALETQSKFKDFVHKMASWCDEAHINSLPSIFGDYKMAYYLDICKCVIKDYRNFSTEDERLISHIRSEKNVDSIIFMALRYRIEKAVGNSSWIDSFCVCGGIKMLVDKLVTIQSVKAGFSRYHARAVFQIMKCMRMLIQIHGVSYVISSRGAIQAFVMSLDFTYKPLVIEVLEILSVILYTREEDAIWEVKIAFKQLAKLRNEKPFACFTKAMLIEDIPVKIAVLDFINNFFDGQEDIAGRIEDRVHLESAGFTSACEEAVSETCSKQSSIKHSSLRKQAIANLMSLKTIEERERDDDADSDYGELEHEDDEDMGVILKDYDIQSDISFRAKVSGMWSIVAEEPVGHASEFRLPRLGFSDTNLLYDTWVEIRGLEIWFWEHGTDYNTQPPNVVIPVRMLESIDYFTTHAEIQMKFEYAFCLCFEDGSKIHCGFDDIQEMDQWSQNLHNLIDRENEVKCVFPSIYDNQAPAKRRRLLKSFVVYQQYDANDSKLVAKDLRNDEFLNANPALINNYIELRMLLLDNEEVRENVISALSTLAVTLMETGDRPPLLLGRDELDVEPDDQADDNTHSNLKDILCTPSADEDFSYGEAYPSPPSDGFATPKGDVFYTPREDSGDNSLGSIRHLKKVMVRYSACLRKSCRPFSNRLSGMSSVTDDMGYFTPKEAESPFPNLSDSGQSSTDFSDYDDDGDGNDSPDTKVFKYRKQLTSLKNEVQRLNTMLNDQARLADAIEERTVSMWNVEGAIDETIKDIVVQEVAAQAAALSSGMSFSSKRSSMARKSSKRVSFGEEVETPASAEPITVGAAVSSARASMALSGPSKSPEDLAMFKNMKESIRRKMYMQGYSKEEVDKFIGDSDSLEALNSNWMHSPTRDGHNDSPVRGGETETAAESKDTLSPQELEKFGKYYLQRVVMKRPVAAVRAMMVTDGISNAEIDRFLNLTGKAKAPSVSAEDSSPTSNSPIQRGKRLEDSRYEKFKSMQSANVPEMAIRQKMSSENISEADQNAFFDDMKVASVTPRDSEVAASAGATSTTSATEDTKFEKFRKMQKMGLPEGAIRQKMSVEGISLSEVELFFKGPVASVTVGNDDDSKLDKYRKMQKMNMPEGAIRQKMTSDGITSAEQEAFLAGGASAQVPQGGPSADDEDPKLEKFRKMKKMNMPEGAIRQKMSTEGISVAEQDAFFSGKPPLAPSMSSTGEAETVDDPKFEKFRKMQKMNMPEGAIRQKMASEGCSVSEQEAFFSGRAAPSTATIETQGSGTVAVVSSGPSGDPRYAKFRTMLKMKQPEGAIRQKMVVEGLSESEINSFFAAVAGSSAAVPTSEPPLVDRLKHEPSRKMRNVFITKIPNRELVDSVWTSIDEVPCDWSDLEQNFGDAKAASRAPGSLGTPGSGNGIFSPALSTPMDSPLSVKSKHALVALFDGKRTQNTSIFITSCRKSVDELYTYAVCMAPELLTKDMTTKLLINAPTEEECAAVSSYDYEALDVTGKLFKKLSEIPRLNQRLDVQLIIFNWDARADELFSDLNMLTAATNEVNESMPQIKQTFAVILSVVNYLNAGTARAQAVGMKIEDLVRGNRIPYFKLCSHPHI
jgi:hypothetical protein